MYPVRLDGRCEKMSCFARFTRMERHSVKNKKKTKRLIVDLSTFASKIEKSLKTNKNNRSNNRKKIYFTIIVRQSAKGPELSIAFLDGKRSAARMKRGSVN